MKRFISILLFIVLLVSLVPPVNATENPLSVPSWVDEYVVLDDGISGETRALIIEARTYAEGGGVRDGAFDADLGNRLDAIAEVEDAGINFELGLIYYKLYLNENLWAPTENGFTYFYKAVDTYTAANTKPDKAILTVLYLWSIRTGYRPGMMPENNVNFVNSLEASLYLDIPMSKVSSAAIFDLAPSDVRIGLRDLVRVSLNGYLLYPSQDASTKNSEGYYDLSRAHINEGTTMVQIRTLAEALELTVGWDEATKTITLKHKGGKDFMLTMTLGETTAHKNGEPIELSMAPYAIAGRTYVPLRFVSEHLEQMVDWDGARTVVSISSRYIEPHYIERWMMPMGSYLIGVDRAAAGLASTYYTSRFPDGRLGYYRIYSSSRSTALTKLNDTSWGIYNRADLIDTVLRMTFNGHNSSFMQMVEFRKSLADEEYAYILENADETDKFMFPMTDEIYAKYGDKGIICWDLFRMSSLVQWGFDAGYITYDEAIALLQPSVLILMENFSSWDEAYENYLYGYLWWSRTEIPEGGVFQNYRGKLYNNARKRFVVDAIFDDSLFTSEFVPVETVNLDDLIAEIDN